MDPTCSARLLGLVFSVAGFEFLSAAAWTGVVPPNFQIIDDWILGGSGRRRFLWDVRHFGASQSFHLGSAGLDFGVHSAHCRTGF
jgi:hypothetical protein